MLIYLLNLVMICDFHTYVFASKSGIFKMMTIHKKLVLQSPRDYDVYNTTGTLGNGKIICLLIKVMP